MNSEQKQDNPLLSRLSMPGETFRLPSGGVLYEEGVLDPSVKNGEVHVYPMTAMDEILMKTPDKLFSGEAVYEIFSRCIPQVLNAGRLFAKDVDYLLICLRKVSYGEELRLELTHDCEDAKEHTYTINITSFLKNTKEIDPTTTVSTFSVELDNGQTVTLQPIRFDDYVQMLQVDNDDYQDMEKLKDIVIRSTSSIIHSVDGYTDQTMIRQWLEQVPPKYTREINEHVNATLQWGPDFSIEVECKDCKEQMEATAPLNPLVFFT